MSGTAFVSFSLTGAKKSHTFDPDIEIGEQDADVSVLGKQGLILKQIILGPDAKDGERQVIQVQAAGVEGENAPLAILEAGKVWQIPFDLQFSDLPITFTLTHGSGPVHVQGNSFAQVDEEDVEGGEEEDDEDISEGEQEMIRKMQETVKGMGKKRKLPEDASEVKNGKASKISPKKDVK